MVCPDGHGEGSRVLLEHLQSIVLRRASVTSTSISKIYCPNAIIVNIGVVRGGGRGPGPPPN